MELLTDITPLREIPAFRRLWIGNTVSATGAAMTQFANTLQVWDLTRSTTATGGIAVAIFVPMLVIALPGGSVADRVDRRGLILVVTTGQAAVSALLFLDAVLAHTAGSLWVIYALVAVASGLSSVSQPARTTFIPSLVPSGQLASAMALNRISSQTVMIAGPALAGVLSGAVGVRGCYLADVLSFVASFYGVLRLPPSAAAQANKAGKRKTRAAGLHAIGDGLRFIFRSQALAGAFLADLNATFFALPVSLFPAINAERFGGDPRTLGAFTAAVGAGGMITAVLSGPVRRIARQGAAMLVTVSVWGLAFAVFAVAPSLWLTLLALGVAGAADAFTVIFRSIIVQRASPEEFRGRVNAADYVVGFGGAQLGSLESGLVGSFASPELSALSGGLATVIGAVVLAASMPGFRRYRDTGHGDNGEGADG